MSPVKIVKNKDLSGYKILIIAIVISFAWHVFWLSAVKIVSSPMSKGTVSFSKISFLGPILSKVSMDLRASPAERSLPEKRYKKIAGSAFHEMNKTIYGAALRREREGVFRRESPKFSTIVDSAISGDKVEPDYPAE